MDVSSAIFLCVAIAQISIVVAETRATVGGNLNVGRHITAILYRDIIDPLS